MVEPSDAQSSTSSIYPSNIKADYKVESVIGKYEIHRHLVRMTNHLYFFYRIGEVLPASEKDVVVLQEIE